VVQLAFEPLGEFFQIGRGRGGLGGHEKFNGSYC